MSSLREKKHLKNQHDAFSVFQYTHDPSANRANNFTEGSNIEKKFSHIIFR